MPIDISNHPCFNPDAHKKVGRVHLPVAPDCNLGCNFCNRKFDCLNESRPGVTSKVLSPRQAIKYLESVIAALDVPLTVVGIAGPGDPFANADATMETLRLVRDRYPEMILCVASNGLGIGPYVSDLADLATSHVTITVNAVAPQIGEKIYRFVRPGKFALRGLEGATVLLGKQLEAIRLLKERGITVKVNTIVMPGMNDHHIEEIARTVSELGADVHNCMALCPVEETPFFDLGAPTDSEMASARAASGKYLKQMTHCTRCRADAAGLLGDSNGDIIADLLSEAASLPLDGGEQAGRPFVAVASLEGVLVNQHLGEAEQVHLFKRGENGFEFVETRPTPLPGLGEARWRELAGRLGDCRAVLCAAAGQRPKMALAVHGIRLLVAEGLIDEALEAVYADQRPRMPVRAVARGGDGTGCGGCSGPGTGCG